MANCKLGPISTTSPHSGPLIATKTMPQSAINASSTTAYQKATPSILRFTSSTITVFSLARIPTSHITNTSILILPWTVSIVSRVVSSGLATRIGFMMRRIMIKHFAIIQVEILGCCRRSRCTSGAALVPREGLD